MSKDFIEEEGITNLYGFVKNAPVNLLDPLGLREIGFGPSASAGISAIFGAEVSVASVITSKGQVCVILQITGSTGPQMGFFAGPGITGCYSTSKIQGPAYSLGATGFAGSGPGVVASADLSRPPGGKTDSVTASFGKWGPTVGVGAALRVSASCTGCASVKWGPLAVTLAQIDAQKCIADAMIKLTKKVFF